MLIDQKGGNNLLYLPLDKLMQMTGPPAPARRAEAARPPAPAEPSTARSPRGVPQSASGSRADESATSGTILVGVVVALIIASLSLFIVDQRQNAIVFRLGEVVHVVTEPGLYSKMPLLDNVRYFDTRILTIDTAEPERFLTSEKKNVLVDLFVKWRITDVRAVLRQRRRRRERARRRGCCRRSTTACAPSSATARCTTSSPASATRSWS